MTAPATRLGFGAGETTIGFAAGPVLLPLSPRSLAERRFRHDPPTPLELEQAIDEVEDALTATRLASAERGALVTADPHVRALPGLAVAGASLTRDGVEMLFQQLASVALGQPRALAGFATSGEAAATLLILRECMHHLGFDAVQAAAA
jgi:hypothetical protein